MKTSVNWLKSYVDMPWTTAELAERLTLAGLEVEGIETLGAVPETVVVGQILSREAHPNADRLSVCRVEVGASEPLQVVCGAPNCDAGVKVACALVGTALSGMTIRKAKIRGVESSGMLCAEDELGLGDGHAGILVLPADARIGAPVVGVIGSDAVIDWEVTPNRTDWNSHLGIAREIAAVAGQGQALRLPSTACPSAGPGIETLAAVAVEAPDRCPRYVARMVRNVRIGPSPEWLQRALKAVGVRPINNVVDITNYVMMECGQPLHAFDYELLEGHRIVVRRARPGERMVTLDDIERVLTPEDLLICDGARPVALAGVMGGANSVIRDETQTVLLESACFAPSGIRATSRRVGLSSESSYRFERGVDVEMCDWASRRAIALMCELAGGEAVEGCLDVYPQPAPALEVTARFARIEALIGIPMPPETVVRLLTSLGMAVVAQNAETLTVRIPSWRRSDLLREADLIEEVARLYGLNNIPSAASPAILGGPRSADRYYAAEVARAQLRALGLNETMTYSFVNPQAAVRATGVSAEQLVRPVNPLSAELGAMRPSLIPGVLATTAHNLARGQADLAFFEMGRVFIKDDALPEERQQIAVVMTGRASPERYGEEKKRLLDFYDLKGVLEGWFAARRLSPVFAPAEHAAFRSGTGAAVSLAGEAVAWLGEAGADLTAGLRLQAPLWLALVEFDRVRLQAAPPAVSRPLPQFPSVERDVSFVAPAGLSHRQVIEAIAALRLPLVERVELFDIYADEAALGPGRQSMAYSVIYRDPTQTLTDKVVNDLHEKLRNHLASSLGVELR